MEVSQTFFNKLENKLENVSDNLEGYYKTFNNCREQGLMLTIHDLNYDTELLIWACECRNTDQIMVIIADKNCSNINDMFDDTAYKSAKYFSSGDYSSAVNHTYNVIKKQFYKNFLESYNIKFQMHKCLADLQHIESDVSNLDYEDYCDLATVEDADRSFFCNLIVLNGKMGLRYSKYTNQYKEDFDNLIFEEWNPDLTSDVTLMLGMQQKLREFIDKEIDYNIEVSINI